MSQYPPHEGLLVSGYPARRAPRRGHRLTSSAVGRGLAPDLSFFLRHRASGRRPCRRRTAARKELATELGCPAELMDDSAKMNMWLHKTVLRKLAENGGNVPQELLD